MSRKNFGHLLDLIKFYPVFDRGDNTRTGGATQDPKSQLLVLLHFLWTEEFNALTTRSTHFVGYGTHYLYMKRDVTTIRSLKDSVVSWLDEAERREISQCMNTKYDFPNCVGVGNGTLFPLAFAPSTSDAPDYSRWKYGYNLTCFIINDDKRRIRQYLDGWSGSVHDNRVLGKMKVNLTPVSHFTGTEYILSESALENCSFVVAAYRKPPNHPMPPLNKRFNTKLAYARILADHTIGMLKGCFP